MKVDNNLLQKRQKYNNKTKDRQMISKRKIFNIYNIRINNLGLINVNKVNNFSKNLVKLEIKTNLINKI
jgi:hypothetical protein